MTATVRKRFPERFLSPIAEVHAGETAGVLLLALNLVLVLGAYYMLKTVRESLILTEGGAEVKAYSAAGQAILLLLLVPAFGAFASRVNRIQLLGWVTAFLASNIALFIAVAGAVLLGCAGLATIVERHQTRVQPAARTLEAALPLDKVGGSIGSDGVDFRRNHYHYLFAAFAGRHWKDSGTVAPAARARKSKCSPDVVQ